MPYETIEVKPVTAAIGAEISAASISASRSATSSSRKCMTP